MASRWHPRVLSVSAVQLYTDCPAAFHRRYVAGIRDGDTGPMAFGRAMAQALEAEHSGKDGDVAWLRSYESEVVAAGLREAAPLTTGLALLAAYRRYGVVQGQPEARFELYLPNRDAVPVPILGYLDVLAPDEVIEFKTTSTNGWDQGRVDNSLQAHVYRWAFTQLRHRQPRQVRFIVLHTRRLDVTEWLTYPSGGDLAAFELRAAAVWRGIRDGQYPPRCQKCSACQAAGTAVPLKAASEYPSLEWST